MKIVAKHVTKHADIHLQQKKKKQFSFQEWKQLIHGKKKN